MLSLGIRIGQSSAGGGWTPKENVDPELRSDKEVSKMRKLSRLFLVMLALVVMTAFLAGDASARKVWYGAPVVGWCAPPMVCGPVVCGPPVVCAPVVRWCAPAPVMGWWRPRPVRCWGWGCW